MKFTNISENELKTISGGATEQPSLKLFIAKAPFTLKSYLASICNKDGSATF